METLDQGCEREHDLLWLLGLWLFCWNVVSCARLLGCLFLFGFLQCWRCELWVLNLDLFGAITCFLWPVIIKHAHGGFKITEPTRVQISYLFVSNLLLHYLSIEIISRWVSVYVHQLTDLGQLQRFVYATLMLSVRRVEIVLDAVVASTRKFLCDVSPFVP